MKIHTADIFVLEYDWVRNLTYVLLTSKLQGSTKYIDKSVREDNLHSIKPLSASIISEEYQLSSSGHCEAKSRSLKLAISGNLGGY